MKRVLIHLILLACLLYVTFTFFEPAGAVFKIAPTPDPATQTDSEAEVERAIQQAIASEEEYVVAYLLNEVQVEDTEISLDKNWAVSWLVLIDPDTGDILPTEPGLVLAQRDQAGWRVTLPSDAGWADALLDAPVDLVPLETKATWLMSYEQQVMATSAGPFGGYLLPWEYGKTVYMSQSVGHDRYTPSGSSHYAFDFYVYKSMFDLYAAKAGTVKRFRIECKNDDPNCANWLVLEDKTTSPVSYQLYLHLAQDSIPPALRVIGAPVAQGQFIGVADNTGQSTGHHLHYQVHTNPNSYWGTSVDITFSDVSINGGRPRVQKYDQAYCRNDDAYQDVCTAFSDRYISGNTLAGDRTPPYGDILAPAHGISQTGNSLSLQGWAKDNESGLSTAQFIANYNGAWHRIGNPFNTPTFSMAWDLCADQVPDGPVSLALELQDKSQNLSRNLPGLRHFTKNFTCQPPPPACIQDANQVAIFAGPDFSGACSLFAAGAYTTTASLGTLGNDTAASIQVGANVQATLFMDSNLRGRGETFTKNDSNLADNRIGTGSLSSMVVKPLNQAPAAPVLTWPAEGGLILDTASLSLVWDNPGGATQYQARIEKNGVEILTLPWQTEPVWHIGSLAVGDYAWQVKARFGLIEGLWSAKRNLKIQASPPAASAPVLVPFTDDMEAANSSWSSNGNWQYISDANHTPQGTSSWRYGISGVPTYETGSTHMGDLTSPPVSIPVEGQYFLRFWYTYETESSGIHWDQRWVQISVDGGPFTNILQLLDDPLDTWLQSPVISLAPYSGRTIRIRFHFETLDMAFNAYKGWYIDDFSITASPAPACSSGSSGSSGSIAHPTPGLAREVVYGEVVLGEICPGGEIDYYKFRGTAGDQVGVVVEGQDLASKLDPSVYLLDEDGASVLAYNDDQVHTIRTDAFLAYRLPRTGAYFIKVQAWDHPTGGGGDYTYRLRLIQDREKPAAGFVFPKDGDSLSTAALTLAVSANDAQSGISRVQFLMHPADWQNAGWEVLGEDWDGSDGWSYPFDAQGLLQLSGIGFYARVYDWAGNWAGAGVWNLKTPDTVLYLPAQYK